MEQASECNNRNEDVNNKRKQIEDAKDHIEWMKGRIQKNLQRAELLSSTACDGNINYIDGVKNSRMFLNIIVYLRQCLQNYSADAFLQQKEETVTHLSQLVKIYNDFKQGQISNEFLQLMAKTLKPDYQINASTAVNDLINILNQMEKDIQEEISNS